MTLELIFQLYIFLNKLPFLAFNAEFTGRVSGPVE